MKIEKKLTMRMFSVVALYGRVSLRIKQITEKRREELKKGLETWKNIHRGSVMLLTLTFSHSQSESLKSLLERQRKAYKIFLKQPR